MGLAASSKCFCFLLLVSSMFLLFNSELLETALELSNASKVEIAGASNVGVHFRSKFRMLLGLHRKQDASTSPTLAPAPAPAHEATPAVPAPHIHTPINTRAPSSHRKNTAPSRSTKYKREDGGKARWLRRNGSAILAMVGAALIVLGLTIALLVQRPRKIQKSFLRPLKLFSHGFTAHRSPAIRKVSSHPSPDLLHLSSLVPYQENDPGPKQASELIRGECTVVCPDEENLSCESLHSDEHDESFHPASCSPSSDRSLAEFSLQIFVQTSTSMSPSSPHSQNSPSDSSYKSLSPVFRSKLSSTRSSIIPKSPAHFNVHQIFNSSPKSDIPHNENNQERYAFSGPPVLHKGTEVQQSNSKFQKPPPEIHSPSFSTKNSPTPVKAAKLAMTGAGSAPRPLPPPAPSQNRPPPNQKGHSSGQPPLPPPLPLQTQVTEDGSTLPRLKPLHWDKVRAAPNRSMVWDDIRSSSFDFELDEHMIKSLFGYNFQGLAKDEDTKSRIQAASKHVMEHHKLQNTTILLKTLNASTEQVCKSIIDGAGLSVLQLEALVKMRPTKEEEEKLLNYDKEINKLDPAERFVKVVLAIPMAFSRMEVMLYKENFDDEIAYLKTSLAMIEGACRELRCSRLFRRVLEAVLKTGNRMNIGTIRGGARAFKLDALLKLADVRGTDGKTTLLHFVVQELVRSKGIKASVKLMGGEESWAIGTELISELSNELGNVKKAASIDLDTLVNSISNLSCGMAQLRDLVEKDLTGDGPNTSFFQCMRSFLNHAEKTMQELKDAESRTLINVREITEYYHGDVSKDEPNMLHIFIIVKDFLGLLDRVCREMRSSKSNQPLNLVLPSR